MLVAGSKGLITHPGGNMTNRDINNFEPRVGLAWRAGSKLVVRTGFALMHVDLGLAPNQLDEYSISTTQSQVSGQPEADLPDQPGASAHRVSRAPLRRNAAVPRLQLLIAQYHHHRPELAQPLQHDLEYEPAISAGGELPAAGDLRRVGRHRQSGNSAVQRPAVELRSNNPTPGFLGNSQIFRPYANYGTINYRGNYSHSTYHAGTIQISKRLSQGLTFNAFYTYAKSIDGSGIGNVLVSSRLYKGLSNWDRRQRFVGNMTYDLPFGKGRTLLNRGGVVNALFGGYTFVWTYDIYTGNPVTLGFTNSPYNYLPGFMGIGGRPNLLGFASPAR